MRSFVCDWLVFFFPLKIIIDIPFPHLKKIKNVFTKNIKKQSFVVKDETNVDDVADPCTGHLSSMISKSFKKKAYGDERFLALIVIFFETAGKK